MNSSDDLKKANLNTEAAISALAIFDRVATLDRLDGDEELFKELIEIFSVDSEQQLAQLKIACDSKSTTDVHRVAHAIKGALGNIGAMRCHHTASEIELQAKAGTCNRELLMKLQSEIKIYLEHVKQPQ